MTQNGILQAFVIGLILIAIGLYAISRLNKLPVNQKSEWMFKGYFAAILFVVVGIAVIVLPLFR